MSLADKLKSQLSKYDVAALSQKETFVADGVWANTSMPELDYNLCTLGFPKGLIEISGMSMSGKTTVGLTIMGNFLEKYGEEAIGIFLLSEQRFSKEYAATLGVDLNNAVIVRSKFVEDMFYKLQLIIDDIEALWEKEKREGLPKIIVLWDSISGTNSRAELETFKNNTKVYKENLEKGTKKDLKFAKMASFASSAQTSMKAILAQLYEKDIVFIALNHLKDDLNNPMGGKKSTGGSWREYFSTIRLTTTRIEWIKIDEEQVAQTTRIGIVKNDWGGRKKTDIVILLGYGIVLSDEDRDYAVERKILKKEGEKSFSYLNGKVKWNSPRTLFAIYQDTAKRKFMKMLVKQISSARHKDVINKKNSQEE